MNRASIFYKRDLFTLIELIVVLSMIMILSTLLIQVLNKSLEAAEGRECAARQGELVRATHQYSNDHNRALPGKNLPGMPGADIDWTKKAQLGQYLGNNNVHWFKLEHEVFRCPSAGELGLLHNWGDQYAAGGIALNAIATEGWGTRITKIINIRVPLSTWGIFVDGIYNRWVGLYGFRSFDDHDPNATWANYSMSRFYSEAAYRYSRRHNGRANVAFIDGHVTSFSDFLEANLDGDLNWKWK